MGTIKRYWRTVLQSGAWLLGIMGTLLVSPDLYEDPGDLAKATRFVVIGVLTLFWVPMLLFKLRRHMWRWWTAAALFFVGSIVCFGLTYYQLDMHTVPYSGHRTVVGTPEELKPDVQEAYTKEQKPIPPMKDLVEEAAGNTEALFPPTLLKHHRYTIYLGYLLTALFTGLLILASGQAVICLKP